MRLDLDARLLILGLSCALHGLGAQPAPQARDECTDTTAVASYRSCALHLTFTALRRGAADERVARAHWLRPVPLSRFVVGDSARAYAIRFERYDRRARVVSAGATLLMMGWVTAGLKMLCDPFPNGAHQCTDGNANHAAVVNDLLLAGVAVKVFSTTLSVDAHRMGDLAVWWHNSRLAR
jgi:hypothetical protein